MRGNKSVTTRIHVEYHAQAIGHYDPQRNILLVTEYLSASRNCTPQ